MAFASMVSNRYEQIALRVIGAEATLGDHIFDHAQLVQAAIRIIARVTDQIDVVAIENEASQESAEKIGHRLALKVKAALRPAASRGTWGTTDTMAVKGCFPRGRETFEADPDAGTFGVLLKFLLVHA